MSRRLRLVNRPRYEVTPDPCAITGCTTPPRAGTLLCHLHARALHRIAQEGTSQ